MQFLPNFHDFSCGAQLPFGDLLKGLKLFLVLLQKIIGHPFDHFACVANMHAT
jgi:hypothetical protein